MVSRKRPGWQPPRPASETLDQALHRIFEMSLGEPLDQFRNSDFAEHFGVSASLVSKVRNGFSSFSESMARKIVRRAGGDDEDVMRLRQAPSSEATSPSAVLPAPVVVPRVFAELGERREAVAFVEYRDRPKTNDDGPHQDLAGEIAEALASGVVGGMFQPFTNIVPSLGEHARNFSSYVGELMLDVRRNHQMLLKRALDIRMKRKSADWATEMQFLTERFALYEMSGPLPLTSGLQTRLMYTEWWDDSGLKQEIWDWVALPAVGSLKHADVVVKRDPNRLPPDAVFDQFAPISTYYRHNKRLPVTAEQVNDAYARYAPDTDVHRRWTRWERR